VEDMNARKGFTLIELLVVIAIIGLLASIVLVSLGAAKNKAFLSSAKEEFKSINTAIELYYSDHGSYPPDTDRSIPPGLEKYLSNGVWPTAPWPGSVFDWDHWLPSDLAYPPQQEVMQISVRFCPSGQPTQCVFPNEPWAAGFDYYSAAYYCISGPCRSHSSQPVTYLGYCINC
jgi:prepilin-type N-terminal cleavage/methylation domain-containing protein